MSDRNTSVRRKSPVVPIVVAALAALALVAALVGVGGGDEADPAAEVVPGENNSAENPLAGLERRAEGDPMALGDPDAPVVMIAYSEFQCPFCGRFARETAPKLHEQYVDEGLLRIEWRDFPYLGEESWVAARAGRAAAAQDKFWEFHDAMFEDQLPPNSGNLDKEYVEAIADQVGLDVDRFRTDMASAETEKAVREDFAEGQSLGITGTPSFLVNGQPIVGAQPTSVFEQAIEGAGGAAK